MTKEAQTRDELVDCATVLENSAQGILPEGGSLKCTGRF